MKNKSKFASLVLLMPVFTIAITLGYIGEADALQLSLREQPSPESSEFYYLRGDMTAPKNDKSFGGEVVGNYLIIVNFEEVKIIAEFDRSSHQDMILEGWLVNFDNESYFSVGQFNKQSNMLHFYQENMEPQIYDLFIVTEESVSDTDSREPTTTVGGVSVPMKISANIINIGG